MKHGEKNKERAKQKAKHGLVEVKERQRVGKMRNTFWGE